MMHGINIHLGNISLWWMFLRSCVVVYSISPVTVAVRAPQPTHCNRGALYLLCLIRSLISCFGISLVFTETFAVSSKTSQLCCRWASFHQWHFFSNEVSFCFLLSFFILTDACQVLENECCLEKHQPSELVNSGHVFIFLNAFYNESRMFLSNVCSTVESRFLKCTCTCCIGMVNWSALKN